MKGKKKSAEVQKLIEQCFSICLPNSLALGFCVEKMLNGESVSLENELLRLMDELQMAAQCIPNMTHPATLIMSEGCAVTSKMV